MSKKRAWFDVFVLVLGITISFPFMLFAQTPIDCGQIVSTSISAAGERDYYTFAGSVNDVVTIRVRRTSGSFGPYLELYNPSGGLIGSASGSDRAQLDKSLTEAGTYTLTVRDSANTYTGNYSLTWQRVNNPCNVTAISCGQPLLGTIANVVELDAYTFTASANDSGVIRASRASGSVYPHVELYDPNGAKIGDAIYAVAGTLTMAGTYTILVRDDYQNYTGNYLVTWHRLNNPCAPGINCGQVLSGTIGTTVNAPPWGFHTFTASASDTVTIRVKNTSGGPLIPYIELYGPTGTLIGSGAHQLDKILFGAGPYTIVVRDQSNTYTGTYVVTWHRLNNSCTNAITCGQGVRGKIGNTTSLPPWSFYSFAASAGDMITIRVSNHSGGPFISYLELYSPNGSVIGSAANQIDMTLTSGGVHTIVVREQSNAYTGSYVLVWQKVNNPCNAAAIGCGQTLAGSLNAAGEIDAFSFTGMAGDAVVLTLTNTSGGLDPFLELYNSSGTRIAYQQTTPPTPAMISQTLSSGETYIVFASDYGNDETGRYQLKYQKNSDSCPEVAVTSPKGGEVIEADTNFTITWTASSPAGLVSQEIWLSRDGGMTFPDLIAGGLAGGVRSLDWSIPPETLTARERVRIIVTDASGMSTSDESDADFIIYQSVPQNVRTYVYDELNRLIQVIYEDGRRVTYTYDAVGNRITLTTE